MQRFTAKFASLIRGVISGADRLVLRGSLRAIQYQFKTMGYLWHKQGPLTGFGKQAQQITRQIKEASLAQARRLLRPVQYLTSSKTDKKTLAERIVVWNQVENGLICVLSCVEPCLSFEVGPNPERKKLELKHRLRKCLFLCHYWMHPVFGFMSVRIRTWFPFQVQIDLNGREWLARQIKAASIPYIRHENCFSWVQDYARAQSLMDERMKTDWLGELGAIARQLNPLRSPTARSPGRASRCPARFRRPVSSQSWNRSNCLQRVTAVHGSSS